MSHENLGNKNVYILNFGKVSITNQTKPAQSTAKRVRTTEVYIHFYFPNFHDTSVILVKIWISYLLFPGSIPGPVGVFSLVLRDV